MVDLRPLQGPSRAPITAGYLARLLDAFAATPLPGESFVAILEVLRPDPSVELEARGLPVASRRRVPPSGRLFRSAALTLDSFLLRGAEVGTSFRADREGARGTVYHTAGGALPLASGLPVVATLLDLAPWELPERYARSPAARFGHRLRARILRDATRLIVPSRATAESARRRLHIPAERISVVPLAPGEAFRFAVASAADGSAAVGPAFDARTVVDGLRQRLDLPKRFFVYAGRYDARKDMATLFDALAGLKAESPASALGGAWPPVLAMAGTRAISGGELESDSSALGRAVERRGLGDVVRLTPPLEPAELAALIAGARGFVYPALSDSTGLPVAEALAVGAPVIASKAGCLPELVGAAGIIVEPRQAGRLAAALRTLWSDDALHHQLRAVAAERAARNRRTWTDVARETRAVYSVALADAASRG
ncbi:MAG: glycosyltransferase [Chloroflexi bacterium]|nr:glycosyltransferase [Chloroflexota bacterium]